MIPAGTLTLSSSFPALARLSNRVWAAAASSNGKVESIRTSRRPAAIRLKRSSVRSRSSARFCTSWLRVGRVAKREPPPREDLEVDGGNRAARLAEKHQVPPGPQAF